MKKNIIAMAVAAAVAAPAAAMADTTLYGKIHVSYDFQGGDNAQDTDYSLSSNSSRIGVKGKEAISDNLSLIYQWETTVDFGDSGNGIGEGPRNTFVGFTGDWGTAFVGRHDTPFKKVGRKYDLFGDQIGDSRAIIRGRGASDAFSAETGINGGDRSTVDFDQRLNNMVAYVTPDMGGFSAVLGYVSDWKDGSNKFDAYSMSAGYEIGGFMIDAGYEQHNAGSSLDGDYDITAFGEDFSDSEEAYRIGAGYKMGGFKVVGLYQSISDLGFVKGVDVDMWGLGGAYSFGKSTIKAQYYMADDIDIAGADNTDADLWAVGYDYKLSKQTSVYAAYASMTQGNAISSYALGSGTGHGESVSLDTTGGATGQDSNAFSVGLVHKF